ncbi:Undecaprenyl-phosphate 4-deoxy-4-formamido-L-arabinose transferase [Novipirellula galeiformis]|uniref:Undecaprenyl-phosphate 4-deoxy-4-formamido-L-arabinose transferase n=1 Tax=Novipirellula galeiformis TaxID=2528004 RepID=A0A5C6CGZ8_9BACT|nr:glycosyltransferase [Novipirellula galeiformis]TWU23017.1 Undecaprenyl-phosphate 4-deoxy-4-formamido-L-arabinose transferase [Novipirellula galeiformis]
MKMNMYHPIQATIIVPCYNEADRLDVNAFAAFANQNPMFRFMMVDDGSRDATQRILSRLCESNSEQFELLLMKENVGKAEAVRHGMLAAAQSSTDVFGFLDADLASPLEELPRALDVLHRHPHIGVAIGIRRKLLGHQVLRSPLRCWLGAHFSRVASWVLRLPIQDTQCGLKLFRNTPRMAKLFAQPFQSRWIFDVEIFARMMVAEGTEAVQQQIYEMPLESWREVPGSKLKSGDFFKALGELVAIHRSYKPAASGPATAPMPGAAIEHPVSVPMHPLTVLDESPAEDSPLKKAA